MKSTVFVAILILALTFGLVWLSNHPAHTSAKTAWCEHGGRAVVVGSGRDVTGTITVLYGCESDLEAKL